MWCRKKWVGCRKKLKIKGKKRVFGYLVVTKVVVLGDEKEEEVGGINTYQGYSTGHIMHSERSKGPITLREGGRKKAQKIGAF